MNPDIINSLIISIVGMGLVFAAILLLWGLMALLVHLTPEKVVPEETDSSPAQDVPSLPITNLEIKRKAAVAAVAYALAQENDTLVPHEFPLPPTAVVSAWQVVTRSKMLNQRGSVR